MEKKIGHYMHNFCLVFEYKSIEKAFKYLKDMLDIMVDVEKKY